MIHQQIKEMLERGIIDTEMENLVVDNWFDSVEFTFLGTDTRVVSCKFSNCFKISLSHDRTYSKGKNQAGDLNYKYFIQDVEITEDGELYIFKISAWPLDGEIVCRKIEVL